MTTDRDPGTRLVLSWLREDAHENAERMLLRTLDEVDATPQRRSWRPAWRRTGMTSYATPFAAAAMVLVVAIGGYQLLSGGLESGGTSTTLSPRLPLLARGEFDVAGGRVSLRAIADGSSVEGRLNLLTPGAESLDVDLQCTRTTDDNLVLIGGDGQGIPAAIVLKRGSPMQAAIWSGGLRASQAADCLAYLDEQLSVRDGNVDLEPIEGFVELGVEAPPAPAELPLLARGSFVNGDTSVELDAAGEGDNVTGRMTVASEGGAAAFTVDLQCVRMTEDGLILLGGYSIDTAGGGSSLSPPGALAGIALKRGSPAEATTWSQRGGPTSAAPTCLAYVDEQLQLERRAHRDGDWMSPVQGTIELGGSPSGEAGNAASPSPALLARGTFVTDDRAVELEAFARGATVTGHMNVSNASAADDDWSYTVDLQCAQATREGLILIGGRITESTTTISSADTWAAIVLKPGSPVGARIWTGKGGQHPVGVGPTCQAALDAGLDFERSGMGFGLEVAPIRGTVVLGP